MKIVHIVLSFLNLMASIIGGIYFLWLDGRQWYISEDFIVGGIILTLATMVAIGYVARIHWKISHTEDRNIVLTILSIINIALFISGWIILATCADGSCMLAVPILFLLPFSFIITLISSLKINYELFQRKQGLTPRWPKLALKISIIVIIICFISLVYTIYTN